MKFKSVWKKQTAEYPKLKGDIVRDIVIVGGGIAGYLTAFKLSERGQKVTLIEADKLFSGTTGRTTAKISSNQGDVYSELYDRYGKENAALYYKAQTEGIKGFCDLVKRYDIDCDFKAADGYVFSRGYSEKLKKAFLVMNKIGSDVEEVREIAPLKAEYAIKESGQYLFDPIKFLSALPVGFEIYEHTRAVNIDAENRVIETDSGRITADKIIIATHFPIIVSHGAYFMKLRQSMSYTIATEGRFVEDMYLEEKENGLSVRPYSGGTLIGGGDHRTGRMKRGECFKELERAAKEIFPSLKITERWCAEDVMTFDKMPMAGLYSENLPNVYVVTGFNKWGMTNAMVCSSLLRDLIIGIDNEYKELFSPQRKIKKCLGAFLSNSLVNVKGIALGYCRIPVKTSKDVKKGEGMIVWHKGKRRAVYRGNDNRLYVIGNKCPHMHCELKWNGNTNSWDCPCHGSRFDIYGNIICEPSTKNCKFDEGE